MSNNEKYVCVNCVEQISKKDAEIAALLKQWNDLDRRNEVRHREWNTKLTEKDAEIERLQADNERLRVLLKRALNPMVTGSVPSFIKLIDDIKKEVYGDE